MSDLTFTAGFEKEHKQINEFVIVGRTDSNWIGRIELPKCIFRSRFHEPLTIEELQEIASVMTELQQNP